MQLEQWIGLDWVMPEKHVIAWLGLLAILETGD